MTVFIAAGALAGLGGVVLVSRVSQATASLGDSALFPVLTAVILGGAGLQGGRGRIENTLIASVFLASLLNGLILLGVDAEYQRILLGAHPDRGHLARSVQGLEMTVARSVLSMPNQLINGRWVPSATGRTVAVHSPANGEQIAEVAAGDVRDVEAAVAAARRAFDEGPWPRMAASERGRYLLRIAALIERDTAEIAHLESLNNGKPIRESSRIDVPLSADCFEYWAGYATKITGETLPVPGDVLSYTLREPLGVVAAITPFNFPLLLASWKLAPALAAGNTVVIKPASDTPLTTIRLGEICQEAGLPPGVVNVVIGDAQVGQALVDHDQVDKITFTGSTEVGKMIAAGAAGNLKRVSLELGGKAPNIVFADAPLEDAVAGALFGVYWTQGEICTAGSRLLVQRPIFDDFVSRFTERAQKLRVGDPLDPRTDVGPLISARQCERVMEHIRSGSAEGARLLAGGNRPTDAALARGHYVAPTVFVDVRPDMRIAREEIFGPVASIMPFDAPEDAVRIANDTVFGLTAGVWTRDVKLAHRVARAVRAGTVWINMYNVVTSEAPFGGYRPERLGARERTPCDRGFHRGQARLRQPRRALDRLVRGGFVIARSASARVEPGPATAVAEVHLPPRVNFGRGALATLGPAARGYGRMALLITDRGLAASNIVRSIERTLAEAGVDCVVFDRVEPNPTIEQVEAALAAGAGQDVAVVVSAGGGSAHDCAKTVALVAANGGEVRDYEGVDRSAHRAIPLICVNTTSGSGADVSRYAVISDTTRELKMIIADRHLMPRLAINDPLLTAGLPRNVTMASGLDALTHAIEAYVSTLASELSDVYAQRAIELISGALVRAVEDGDDLEARDQMMLGALMAGLAINSALVGAVHAMAHQLGGVYDLPHGVCNGILLPHVIEFNEPAARTRYTRIARTLSAGASSSPIAGARAYAR